MNSNWVPPSVKTTLLYRAVRAARYFPQNQRYRRIRQRLRGNGRQFANYLAQSPEPKLHLGCGEHPLGGWLNTDYFPDDPNILHLDLTQAFPLPDNSFELIFSEHVIEHLPLAGGLNMLREAYRVLKPGGRIRISTPPLPALLAIYAGPDAPDHRRYLDWHGDAWLAGSAVQTPAIVINDFMRNWGHLLIYDVETLAKLMKCAGFEAIVECQLQQSDDVRLRGLENDARMPDGLLALMTMTLEASKPAD